MNIETQPTIVPIEQLPQTDEPKKKRKDSRNILSKMMKELMEERDIKLAEIQKATNIPWSTLHGWYDGDVTAQILDQDLLELARFFNVTIEYLAFGIGEDSPAYGKFSSEGEAV